MIPDDLLDEAVDHAQAGRVKEAMALCRRVLAEDPENADAMYLLGIALSDSGELAEAEGLIRRAIGIVPEAAEYYLSLGMLLQKRGAMAEAVAQLKQAIALTGLNMEDAGLLQRAGVALIKLDSMLAADTLRKVAKLLPREVEVWLNLGAALHAAQNDSEAEAAYREALSIQPDSAVAHFNLGILRTRAADPDAAIAEYRAAMRLDPGLPQAGVCLGDSLQARGEIAESLAVLRATIDRHPEYWDAWLSYLYGLWFSSEHDGKSVVAEHRRWAALFTAKLPKPSAHGNDRTPGRRIRLGYVSASFGRHVVGMWAEHLVTHHDRDGFEVYCYSGSEFDDPVLRNTAARADRWLDVRGMSDDQLAARVREDRIDLLIDLNACMPGSRLGVFARKPAPVQVSHVGYPGTTGLSQMDWRITDEALDPPGISEAESVERMVRLPCGFYLIVDRPEMPPVNALPMLAAGRFRFGCLNSGMKICAATIDLFSRVLQEVPGSTLLLVSEPGSWRTDRRADFAARGIDPDRIEFIVRTTYVDYLAEYQRIDIGLDPIPYCGGMTTCDALMMGVPVVSLAGSTSPSRAGRSILPRVGLGHLVTDDIESYLSVVHDLTRDVQGLAQLRRELPGRMKRSSILDPGAHCRDLEAAYREMWREWCDI